MLIFENIQTSYYLHTQYIYIYTITQHAPVYTTIANTTMTHSFRNHVETIYNGWALCMLLRDGRSLCIMYIQ